MKFFAVFALMAVASVTAAPARIDFGNGDGKGLAAGPAAAAQDPAAAAAAADPAAQGAAAKGAAAAKGGKGGAAAKAAAAKAAAAAAAAKAAAAASAANSTASVDNAANATASDNSTASATSSAASATRTRACDQGDQSLAAGLQASVVIGIGQQAAVATLQKAAAAADFADGQTRLQQFVDTQSLQLQMAAAIADDGSLGQTQLKLLAASQTAQETMVKSLVGGDAKTSAATLTQLAQSFLDTTNNAQDGASQALIDCFLPLAAVSG